MNAYRFLSGGKTFADASVERFNENRPIGFYRSHGRHGRKRDVSTEQSGRWQTVGRTRQGEIVIKTHSLLRVSGTVWNARFSVYA